MKELYKLIALVALLLCLCIPSQAVTQLIKQNATDKIEFLLVDASSGQVGQTGLAASVVIKVSKASGTGAASAGTVAEKDSVNFPGVYIYTPAASETNTVGILGLHVTCAGCQTQDYAVQVYDPAQFGLTAGQVGTQVGGLFLFDPSGYVKANAQTVADKTGYALTTAPPTLAQITALFPAQFTNLVVDGQGRVTTSNPATQGGTGLSSADISNIVNALFAAPAYGNLTLKQVQGLNAAMMQDADRTYNTTTHTAVSTWYARNLAGAIDKTRPVVVKTTVYDSADKQPVSQTTTLTPSNLY